MTRITDDKLSHLAAVARQAHRHDDETCDGCYCGTCAAMENALDAARHSLPLMLTELRDRRAADLTTADIDILRWLAGMLRDESFNPTLWESSLVVLAKLLAQGEKP